MQLKYKIIISIAVVATSIAVGRFTTPVKTKTITQTVTVEVEKQHIDTKQDKHVETQTKEITHIDGSKEVDTVVTEDDSDHTVKNDVTNTSENTKTEKEVTKETSHLTLSALAAVDTNNTAGIIYGGMVQRNIVGPLIGGAFVLQTGVVGVNLGIQF